VGLAADQFFTSEAYTRPLPAKDTVFQR
jgi:hypothetical protein